RTIRVGRILHPCRFFRILRDSAGDSPWKGMTMALAGTLGVGNITGVSAAMVQGGMGAVFWMWVGALFSMAVKYGEVALAMVYQKKAIDGRLYGGMMYVIRDGLAERLGRKTAYLLGGGFALLCMVNALVTGTIVQSNAAADALHPLPEWVSGEILALLTVVALVYGIDKTGDITLRLVPAMTGIFLVLSLWVILSHISLIPSLLSEIVAEAFSLRALGGGITGMGILQFFRHLRESGMGVSLRYGITRGIFSNEAGCGTSPTAHASAAAVSPFHQGCMGIFEVICDTPLLCTMTALVLCIGDRRYGILSTGGDNLTLQAFRLFGGGAVYWILAGMVAVFAFATILAQMYYGHTAIGYFTGRKQAGDMYTALTMLCTVWGAVMEPGAMWDLADSVICLMTCITTVVLLVLRREIGKTVPEEIRRAVS
ncbi:MAG: amino acid carrier protein, partial [Clostridia bacterium]|nr:amino acid carrier protein [Clostridia bacterium]